MKKNPFFKRSVGSKLAWSVAAAMTLSAGMGNIAYAQDDEALEEITVTGSRIRRQDYNSATPISTFDAQELNNLGIVNAGDALQQMPSNVSRFTPENTGGSAFQIGANLADLRGLNPFFGTRTMTLVDTRRHVSTNQGGSVDLNFIPSVMISRLETVTGGASASYGADAISGVVNILLDTTFEGVKFDIDYGVTGEGDGDNTHMGVAWGTSFGDGRGHFVAGFEMQNQDVIQDCSTARAWCGESNGTWSNGSGFSAFSPALTPYVQTEAGLPYYNFVSDLRYQTDTRGRTFNTVAGAPTYRFNDAGTDIVAFDAGQYSHISATGLSIGGEGPKAYKNLTLMPETSREVFMAHATWDFSDTLTGFVEVSYGNVEGTNIQASTGQNTASACIKPDNAFLNAPGVSAGMLAEVSSFFDPFSFEPCADISKDWSVETTQRVDTDTEVTRLAFGLDGEFSENWSWDAYYQYGETERSQIGDDYRTNHRFNMAMDSVIDPATGQPDCRVNVEGVSAFGAAPSIPFEYAPGLFFPLPIGPSTGTLPEGADASLAAGCVPLSPFGVGTSSQEAIDYAFAQLTEFNTIELNAVAFNVSGELWEGLGAGPMQSAFGVEYREESFINDAGPLPLAIRTDFGLQYGDAFGGELEALEYFAEFELPLIEGMTLAENVTLNFAARQSEYTNSSGTASRDQSMTTWKTSGIWDVTDSIRVRGSISQDARAATYRELYYSQTIPSGGFFGRVTNPWIPVVNPGDSQDDLAQLILGGNVNLAPEEADTRTLGIVITPADWVEGLQFSADYYQIELTGAIALGTEGAPVDTCFNDGLQCDLLTFGPDTADGPMTNIISTTTAYGNGREYNSSGVDFAVNYSFPLDSLLDGMDGDFAVRLLSTHALETIVNSGGQQRNIVGQTGGDQGFLSDFSPSPDWSTNLIFTYMNGPVTVTTQARYISDGILDLQSPKVGPEDAGYDPALTGTVTSNRLPSHTIWNLNGSYTFEDIGQGLTAYVNVENLFDRTPPFSAGGVGGVNAQFFDAMGRSFRFGIRSRF